MLDVPIAFAPPSCPMRAQAASPQFGTIKIGTSGRCIARNASARSLELPRVTFAIMRSFRGSACPNVRTLILTGAEIRRAALGERLQPLSRIGSVHVQGHR